MNLTAEQCIKRYDQLKSARGTWETHWQDVIDYIDPRQQGVITRYTPGTKKGITLFDNTGMVSAEIITAALHGMLTNPNTVWFELSPNDLRLAQNERVIEYLQGFGQTLHGILNNSNFQTEIHEYFKGLSTIGTSSMTIEPDDDRVVRFSTKHISEYCIAENSAGMVDENHRCFKWTAKQIIEEFAEDLLGGKIPAETLSEDEMEKKFGRKVTQAFKKGDATEFEVVHSVYKHDVLERGPKPYASKYVLKDEKLILREKGFRRYPFITSRWAKTSGEVYGRSPAMNALPEVKTLNEMVKAIIQAAQKIINPPVQMPDDGFIGDTRFAPASIHYYRAGSEGRIEQIFKNMEIGISDALIKDRQQQVREAFFVDKFNLVQNDRMTTVEVNQRIEEQLRFLAPMMARQRFETLIPLIDHLVEIVVEADGGSGKYLGDVPPELRDVKLDVQYTSPIARTQMVTEGQNAIRALEASRLAFELTSGSAADVINFDEFVKYNWKTWGAPQKVLRKTNEVEALRQAKQEAQEAALANVQENQDVDNAAKLAPVIAR